MIVCFRVDRDAAKEREKLRDRLLARAERDEDDELDVRGGGKGGGGGRSGRVEGMNTEAFFDSRLRAELRVISLQVQHTATHCNTLQHTATHSTTLYTLQHTATGGATCYSVAGATHCNIRQHTATYGNALYLTVTPQQSPFC